MTKAIATMVGILLLSHGGLGLFVEGEHLLGLFNVDFSMDLFYLATGAALVWAGETHLSASGTRGVVGLVALLHVGVGLLGLLDKHLFGLAPTGYELFDFLLFFGLGGALLLAAVQPRPGSMLGRPDFA